MNSVFFLVYLLITFMHDMFCETHDTPALDRVLSTTGMITFLLLPFLCVPKTFLALFASTAFRRSIPRSCAERAKRRLFSPWDSPHLNLFLFSLTLVWSPERADRTRLPRTPLKMGTVKREEKMAQSRKKLRKVETQR